MKRIALFILCVLGFSLMNGNLFAQEKTKIQEGLYIVNYGGKYVIEDDVNQRSISIEISQERIDDRNNEKMYKIVCGKWTKRIVKTGLTYAIKEGIKQAAASGGSTLIVSAAGTIAQWIYDDACEYWDKKNEERRNQYSY